MKKTVLLDGGVGTSLWELAEKYGFKKDPVWKYNIDHPEIVAELMKQYLEAGSEIVQANTFGANIPAVSRLKYDCMEVIKAGVRITKEVVGDKAKTSLSFGPLAEMLEPFGDLEEDECYDIYYKMVEAGVSAGADVVILETFMDVEMMRIAASAAKQFGKPVFCSLTFEKAGKTMMGNSVQDAIDKLVPLGIDAIGMNCSLGPDLALPIIKEFCEKTDLPIFFKPNAGKPILAADGTTEAAYTPEMFAKEVAPAIGLVDYLGGCCGTNPEYIRLLRKEIG